MADSKTRGEARLGASSETILQSRGFMQLFERKPVRPMVPPIYASSTFKLQSTEEGAELCNSLSSVSTRVYTCTRVSRVCRKSNLGYV